LHAECQILALYAECHKAECLFAERRYTECHGAVFSDGKTELAEMIKFSGRKKDDEATFLSQVVRMLSTIFSSGIPQSGRERKSSWSKVRIGRFAAAEIMHFVDKRSLLEWNGEPNLCLVQSLMKLNILKRC
jgi:hypothetical protein